MAQISVMFILNVIYYFLTQYILNVQLSISGGELFERIISEDFELTERDCIVFMRQICDGVNFMHKKQVNLQLINIITRAFGKQGWIHGYPSRVRVGRGHI